MLTSYDQRRLYVLRCDECNDYRNFFPKEGENRWTFVQWAIKEGWDWNEETWKPDLCPKCRKEANS